MAKRKKKEPEWVDGKYLVTPPVWGVRNAWVGEFEDGDKPRECLLSAVQAKELAGPDHPFTIEPVAADPPPPPPEE